jgi:Tfp pilus assembly protein PilN
VKAVNLLPERHRPKRASGGKQGSSYILLGTLGAIVLAVLVYVTTLNSINTSKTEIAQAKAETIQANARASSLAPYGDFAKVKTERVEAVKKLASGRADWERLVRELAHVLPNGVWVQKASASDGSGASDATSTPASAGSAGAATAGPALTLQGCARDQKTVATALVRLRQIQGAKDVKLTQASKPEADGSTGGSSAGASGDCGTTHGRPNYTFEAVVALDEGQATNATGRAPRSLGGGS